MCNFIGWSTCDTDCTSWGNYGNTVGNTYTGLHSSDYRSDWVQATAAIKAGDYTNRWVFPTGKFAHSGSSTPDTVKKNIYDVAGNVWEWTTEVPNYSNSNSVLRGGSANGDGSHYLAASRGGYDSSSTSAHWYIGFRLALYVK